MSQIGIDKPETLAHTWEPEESQLDLSTQYKFLQEHFRKYTFSYDHAKQISANPPEVSGAASHQHGGGLFGPSGGVFSFGPLPPPSNNNNVLFGVNNPPSNPAAQ